MEMETDVLYEDDENELGTALVCQINSAPWYVGSTAIHLLIFLILLLIPVHYQPGNARRIVITTDIIEEEEVIEDIEKEPITEDPVEVPLESDVNIDAPVITSTDIEISDHFETEDEADTNDSSGDPDLISDFDSEFKGTPALMGIGSSGGKGGGGKFGRRGGGKRRKVAIGGGKGTTGPLEWALKWLAAHQESDGRWDCKKYGGGNHGGDDVAVTSLAMLAFLGNGNSAKFGKYRHNVRSATEWLLTQQNENGLIGIHRYTGGISTMAISEAFGMGDNSIRSKAQAAVDWAVRSQNTTGGWDYAPNSSRTDTSVTGWWIMGLKSAKVSGLNVPYETMDKALEYMRACTNDNGNSSYSSKGGTIKKGGGSDRMTAVALTCLQFLGVAREDAMVDSAAKNTINHLPNPNKFDFYLTYYQALGLFQTGIKKDYWLKFNPAMKDMLITTQVKEGTVNENKGSWNYDSDKYGPSWGRVGQTALGALMLEVYFRYEEVKK
jgi:hypothetical protein